jgi:6-carboxyhexanoate--CoA ligase
MRASKEGKVRNSKGRSTSHFPAETHISGAEGLFADCDLEETVAQYIERARSHSRGEADKIVITLEKVRERPRAARALPVTTLQCGSPAQAGRIMESLLEVSGISERAIDKGLEILREENVMRGAAVLSCLSGRRVDPDRKRGVRVSRLGIAASAQNALMSALAADGIDNRRVMEAVVLATKASLCRPVRAELCVSDNPDYTTGYFSCRRHGYLRIPHIKRKGARNGGRVFFLEDDASAVEVIAFLERKPVLITSFAGYLGVKPVHEFLGDHHK